jgi:hypothetical protein
VASSEQASPGRQRRRHVQGRLLVRDEPLRQEMTETAAPSTAQIRSGQRSAQRRSRSSMAWFAGQRSSPRTRPASSSATAVCDALWGSMPMVITWCLLGLLGRWSTAAGNL